MLQPRVGSADYLVYTKLQYTGHSRTGGLFVLSKDGKTRRLGTVGGQAGGFSLAGSILVYYQATSAYPNGASFWTDLKTGQSGVIPATDDVVAAAPDGWVTRPATTDGTWSLVDQSRQGAARPLGQPFPQSDQPLVFTGADQLVTYSLYTDDSDGNGELRAMSFDDPGTYRTLIATAPHADNDGYRCPSVTAKYVVCRTGTAKGKGEIRLIPLDGSPQVKTTKGCPEWFSPAVMHHSAAWQGCGDKLTVLSPDGKVHVSAHKYGEFMVSAFGKLAVPTLSGGKIELVSSANGTPKTLVSTK
ncbi:MAG TPA: hypothetical protein VHV76_09410 [Mycobacteriales bacterium]|jgi:hypothetical protein|nr:hypothetical protein [Mycobacteriales bacterium]